MPPVTAYELFYGKYDENGQRRKPFLNMKKITWDPDERIRLQFNARWQQQNRAFCHSCHNFPPPPSLEVLGQLGKGSYGSVYLVADNENGKLMAMKTIEKKKATELPRPENVENERKILGSIKFPFIVQGLGHFQTKTHLYILMEYVEGGELWSLVKAAKGGLHQDHILHYLSEICITLEYLHHLGIVYRDLKLENVLLDKEGHIKLVDFGFSKKMVSSRTLCGTAEYLAPEIFQGKEYTKAVDWWAFGILAYELKTGRSLFYSSTASAELRHQEIKKQVLDCTQVQITSLDTGYVFKNMLDKILVLDPEKRLGVQGKVRKHALFTGIDFCKVYERGYKAPIIPTDCKRGEIYTDILHEINFEPFDIEESFKGF